MKYYVYELVNSLDGKVFYVGKGQGNRMFVHEHRAKRNHAETNENRHLRNKILSIWKNGGLVQYRQFFFTDNDMEAYKKETARIEELGINNLCNVFIAAPTPEELYKLRSRQMLGRKLPETTKQKIRDTLMGHSVSEQTRKKIGDSCRGKRNPCFESKRLSIALSRRPPGGFKDVMSPDGIRYSIGILSDFCRAHNLHLPAMCGLLKGRHKSHRGWKIVSQ